MDKHKKFSKVEIERDSYLWATVPKVHKIDLAKELSDRGYSSLANVKLYERNSTRDVLWSVLTLGFWMPKTIVIEGQKKVK